MILFFPEKNSRCPAFSAGLCILCSNPSKIERAFVFQVGGEVCSVFESAPWQTLRRHLKSVLCDGESELLIALGIGRVHPADEPEDIIS